MEPTEKSQISSAVTPEHNSAQRPKLKKANTLASVVLEDYFIGPRDLNKHSKWPVFLRMHGSVTPEMILPLFLVGGWATCITCISKYACDLGINSLLLTVLGFVVGLGLSFRSSTAYERYSEGRKYWTQLTLTSHNLARLIWVHANEREGELGKQDLLAKITCINLIVAFAVALKHKLRFEPFVHYEDLHHLVSHLDTFAKEAEIPANHLNKKKSVWKVTGEFLGLPMAESNPRKFVKNPTKPLGNLPLEILTHLSTYLKTLYDNGTFDIGIYQTQSLNSLMLMNDVLTGTERVLNTPLPIAYSIAISQITWVYILLLPFQLYKPLGWVTIPGTLFAAYIILGIALIGREIENPFGNDVNDLPLDSFCQEIRQDMDVITSKRALRSEEWVKRAENAVLFPLSHHGYQAWDVKSVEQIREALRERPELAVRKNEEVMKLPVVKEEV